MLSFLRSQWRDISGNFKFWILTIILGFLVSVLTALTHGLKWWQQGGLALIYGVVIIWAISVTAMLARRHPASTEVQKAQVAAIPPASSLAPSSGIVDLDTKEFFRTAYYSTLTAEVEKNIRLSAQQNDPHNIEGFLCKVIGIGLVQFTHDMTALTIFRSQFDMLSDMNTRNGWMPLSDAKAYYDKAVSASPESYSTYTFDQWMDYMRSRQLLIQHPSAMLEITVTGKDFLKYLTHWGRSIARAGL